MEPSQAADRNSGEIESLEADLRQTSRRVLITASLVLGLLWLVAVRVRFDAGDPITWLDYVPCFGLLTVGLAAWRANALRPTWAGPMLVLGLLVVVLIHYGFSPEGSLTPFYLVPVVIAAGIACPRGWLIATAATGTAMLVALSYLKHDALVPAVTTTVSATGLAALAAWLANRSLYTATSWALYSHRQAMENLDALRERRGELRRLNDMLQHNQERLHYTNIRLEQARVGAEEAFRTKQHFVANVSHELRTPLSLISGFAEMMALSPESYGGVALPAPYREDMLEIYRSSKHLLSLVEDVLALAQLEEGHMVVQRRWVDLASVVSEAAETMRPLVETKGVRLRVDMPAQLPQVYADAGRMRQVLLNLLNNAYRFTDSGTIRVQVSLANQQIRVAVADTGAGIAEEDIPRVFEEFHSVSKASSVRRGGLGLGLAISRRLMRAHGGDIELNTVEGKGSIFTMSLPLVAQAVDARPRLVRTSRPAVTDSTVPVLLIVGGDQNDQSVARGIEDYRVVFTTADGALEAMEQYLPVAIWIRESKEAVRTDEQLSHVLAVARAVPIIICPLPSRQGFATALGADRLIRKPFSRPQVLEALSEMRQNGPIRSALVVDDDERVLRMMRRILSSYDEPIELYEASGGSEGLRILRSVRPDILFVDLAMPGVDGYELLRQACRDETLADVHTVLMTGVEIEGPDALVHDLSVHGGEGFATPKAVRAAQNLLRELVR
jgi:signal transduction histidine kinase/CheY-like chemotaxis protein